MQEQPTPEQIEQQCIFCQIANGKVESKKVYEDDKVTAVLDINPAAPGHILLLPKKHVSVMPQMDEELVGHIGMVSKQLSQALIKALQVEGTSIFAANGAAAGQRAPHFMLHIIPRKQGDNINLQLPTIRLSKADMNAIVQKIAPGIKKQFGVNPLEYSAKTIADKEVLKKEETEKEKAEEEKEVEKEIKKEEETEKEQEKREETNKENNEENKEEAEKEKEETEEEKISLDDISKFLAGEK